jgi:formamidopyrimidine-DNA glycosylase
MPELPEAQTIARQLHRLLADRRLGTVTLTRRDIVKSAVTDLPSLLSGRHFGRVSRRGKRVIISLHPSGMLVFGLGMSGRLTVSPADADVESHTHLRIGVPESGVELRFRDPRRFGGVWWYESPAGAAGAQAEGEWMADYGIEPLACTVLQFRAILTRRRQVKALLLDQRCLAGLGNIYCDESLHAAKIHPQTVASRLRPGEADRLLKSIQAVLRRAIRHKGSTLMDYRDADGREGSFQRSHRVYGREGQPCRTCSTPIRRMAAAGRSTHFCPRCQRRRSTFS